MKIYDPKRFQENCVLAGIMVVLIALALLTPNLDREVRIAVVSLAGGILAALFRRSGIGAAAGEDEDPPTGAAPAAPPSTPAAGPAAPGPGGPSLLLPLMCLAGLAFGACRAERLEPAWPWAPQAVLAVDGLEMKPKGSAPACTSGRACLYSLSSDGLFYSVEGGTTLKLHAATSIRSSTNCAGLSSPTNGDTCYDTSASKYQFVTGGSYGPLSVASGGTGAATTSQNYVFAGPSSGSGAPGFRALVGGDLGSIVAHTAHSGGGTGTLGAATKYLTAPGQAASSTEIYLGLARRSATARSLYCRLGTAPGGSDTVVFTVRAAGSDSAVTCTISAAATTCNSASLSASLSAGDRLSIKAVSSAGTAAEATCSFEETN